MQYRMSVCASGSSTNAWRCVWSGAFGDVRKVNMYCLLYIAVVAPQHELATLLLLYCSCIAFICSVVRSFHPVPRCACPCFYASFLAVDIVLMLLRRIMSCCGCDSSSGNEGGSAGPRDTILKFAESRSYWQWRPTMRRWLYKEIGVRISVCLSAFACPPPHTPFHATECRPRLFGSRMSPAAFRQLVFVLGWPAPYVVPGAPMSVSADPH